MLNYNTTPSSCRGQITQTLTKFAHKQSLTEFHNINAHTEYVENPLCLLKFSSGNEIRMDGCTTDGRADKHTDVQREPIIPRQYRVAGYKSLKITVTLSKNVIFATVRQNQVILQNIF